MPPLRLFEMAWNRAWRLSLQVVISTHTVKMAWRGKSENKETNKILSHYLVSLCYKSLGLFNCYQCGGPQETCLLLWLLDPILIVAIRIIYWARVSKICHETENVHQVTQGPGVCVWKISCSTRNDMVSWRPERVKGDRMYCRAMVSLNSRWMCRDTRLWILKLLYMYLRNFLWSIKSSSRSVIPSNAEVAANPPVWLPALWQFLERLRQELAGWGFPPGVASHWLFSLQTLPSSIPQPQCTLIFLKRGRFHVTHLLKNFQWVYGLKAKSQTPQDSRPSALWPPILSLTFFPTIPTPWSLLSNEEIITQIITFLETSMKDKSRGLEKHNLALHLEWKWWLLPFVWLTHHLESVLMVSVSPGECGGGCPSKS